MADRITIRDSVVTDTVETVVSDNIVFIVGTSFGGNAETKVPTLCTSLREFFNAFGTQRLTRLENEEIELASDTSITLEGGVPVKGSLIVSIMNGAELIATLRDNSQGNVIGRDSDDNVIIMSYEGNVLTFTDISNVTLKIQYEVKLEVKDSSLLGYQYAITCLSNGFPVLYDSIKNLTELIEADNLTSRDFLKELKHQVNLIGEDRINYDFKFVPTIYDIVQSGDTVDTTSVNYIKSIIFNCTELGDRIVLLDINASSPQKMKDIINTHITNANSYCLCIGNRGYYGTLDMPGSFWYLLRLSESVVSQGNPVYEAIANTDGYVNMVESENTIKYSYNDMMTVGQFENGYGIIPLGKLNRNNGFTLFGNITCLRDVNHVNPYNFASIRLLSIEVKRLLRRIGMTNLFASDPREVIREFNIIVNGVLSKMKINGYLDSYNISLSAQGTKITGNVNLVANGTVEKIDIGITTVLNNDIVISE